MENATPLQHGQPPGIMADFRHTLRHCHSRRLVRYQFPFASALAMALAGTCARGRPDRSPDGDLTAGKDGEYTSGTYLPAEFALTRSRSPQEKIRRSGLCRPPAESQRPFGTTRTARKFRLGRTDIASAELRTQRWGNDSCHSARTAPYQHTRRQHTTLSRRPDRGYRR